MDSEFVDTLRRRVARASAAAKNACADAEVLVEVTEALRTGAISSRCAWCGSYRVAGRWLHESQMPRVATTSHGLAHVSHTICPPCVDELREAGLSA